MSELANYVLRRMQGREFESLGDFFQYFDSYYKGEFNQPDESKYEFHDRVGEALEELLNNKALTVKFRSFIHSHDSTSTVKLIFQRVPPS